MPNKRLSESMMIEGLAMGITLSLFLASFAASHYLNEESISIFAGWIRIMTGPNPLITDYYDVGGLAASFLNAAVCGLICTVAMMAFKGDSKPNSLAGLCLVIAHCFYGLNTLNMLPCFFAPMLYFRLKKLSINDNLHVCMFATCFGPFISEFLFRYTLGDAFVQGQAQVTPQGVLLALGFAAGIGFIIPAILPGARAWHKGYNLFNGGLAFGIFGFFAYNFFYTTFGVAAPAELDYYNPVYDSFLHSYTVFVNTYFILLFLIILAVGFALNGMSPQGYTALLEDTGHMSNFIKSYGFPVCLINIGVYGLLFLGYVNLVMSISEGVGFTGPTTGVIFAALTFASLGQHPKNVWPILVGFIIMYLANLIISGLTGMDPGWTISSQGYINAAAFATGAAPLVGRYGRKAGYAAGIIDATICSATRALHGGLVLYNGGFTIGLTILILLPILEHYVRPVRADSHPVSMDDFIVVEKHGQKK